MTAQQQHWYKNEKYLWVWFSTSLLLKLSAVTVGQGWQDFFQISITSGYFWHTSDFAFNCILHAPFQQSQHMILAYLFQCSFKYRFDIFIVCIGKCSLSAHPANTERHYHSSVFFADEASAQVSDGQGYPGRYVRNGTTFISMRVAS